MDKRLIEIDKTRSRISAKVRELREGRRWTQAELSRQLGLSQSRLSEIECGKGSFTAEQFLTILKIFNVPSSHFAPRSELGRDSEIQNALARLGALHLQEDQVLPSERLDNVDDLVREALAAGSPRFVTALGPVLVRNIDRVNLKKLHDRLVESGMQRRLAWLVENVLDAVAREQAESPPREWVKRYRRVELVLSTFLDFATAVHQQATVATPDILDAEIRSKRTLEDVRDASSPISQRWGIITSLHPEDFALALRASRAGR